MKPRTSVVRASGLLATACAIASIPALLGATGDYLPHAHAASNTMVWVATDVTSQSQCESGWYAVNARGEVTAQTTRPCPAGTIVHVSLVPLDTAVGGNQQYLPENADEQARRQLVQRVRGVTMLHTASVVPNTPCGGTYHATTNYTAVNVGAVVHLDQTYDIDSVCRKYADAISTSYVSGGVVKRLGHAYVYANSCIPYCSSPLATDNTYANCVGLIPAYTTTFGGALINQTADTDVTVTGYNNGCIGTPYDDAVVGPW